VTLFPHSTFIVVIQLNKRKRKLKIKIENDLAILPSHDICFLLSNAVITHELMKTTSCQLHRTEQDIFYPKLEQINPNQGILVPEQSS